MNHYGSRNHKPYRLKNYAPRVYVQSKEPYQIINHKKKREKFNYRTCYNFIDDESRYNFWELLINPYDSVFRIINLRSCSWNEQYGLIFFQ